MCDKLRQVGDADRAAAGHVGNDTGVERVDQRAKHRKRNAGAAARHAGARVNIAARTRVVDGSGGPDADGARAHRAHLVRTCSSVASGAPVLAPSAELRP